MEGHLSDRLSRLGGSVSRRSVGSGGFGLKERTHPLLGSQVEDLSLRGGGQEPVKGKCGGASRDPALAVGRSRLALQRQQVGLLLLQPLVQPLCLALFLQFPPLELLPQSHQPLESGEGRNMGGFRPVAFHET